MPALSRDPAGIGARGAPGGGVGLGLSPAEPRVSEFAGLGAVLVVAGAVGSDGSADDNPGADSGAGRAPVVAGVPRGSAPTSWVVKATKCFVHRHIPPFIRCDAATLSPVAWHCMHRTVVVGMV